MRFVGTARALVVDLRTEHCATIVLYWYSGSDDATVILRLPFFRSICGQFVVNLWSFCGQFVVNFRSSMWEPEKMRTMMMKTTTTLRMIADVYETVFACLWVCSGKFKITKRYSHSLTRETNAQQ